MEQKHGGDLAGYQEIYGKAPLDFSANVSPLGMPAGAYRAAVEAMRTADCYPDPQCRALRAALSRYHDVPEERIVCGAGAADLIFRLAEILRPKTALMPVPTFSEYANALEAVGCRIRRHYLSRERGFRLSGDFPQEIGPGLDLVVLCEPNNPTGVKTDRELLSRILRRCRETGAWLLVDECFLPFLEEAESLSLIRELGEGGLIVLRAFTKFYGMAGLRLGYCLTDEEGLAQGLLTGGRPWPVSGPAQAAGAAALEDAEYGERLRTLIREQREVLTEGLTGLGFEVIAPEADFVLFYTGDDALGRKLEGRGILLRDCRDFPGLGSGWYRAAVRTAPENARLLAALETETVRPHPCCTRPAQIERASLSIVREELRRRGIRISKEELPVVERVIHATADFDYAENLMFTDRAVLFGMEALRAGVPIVTDTNMAWAGVSKQGLARLGCEAYCYMADPEVARAAKEADTTRAAAAVRFAAGRHPNAVFAVGNAPTALLEMERQLLAGFRPSLIVGVPVGFVNVVEAKERLWECCLRCGVPAVVSRGQKGGSNVAAAVLNALIYEAANLQDPSRRGWN